ncbi:MAG: VOC family protein [Halalkalicoccus sp.]
MEADTCRPLRKNSVKRYASAPRTTTMERTIDGFKPNGYPDVAPYLVVESAPRLLEFLKNAFDATERRRETDLEGSIRHVEVQIGDAIVMVGQGSDGMEPFPSMVHVYVPDVDDAYQRALGTGAVAVREPLQTEGETDRRGLFEDPLGNTWAVSTQVDS